MSAQPAVRLRQQREGDATRFIVEIEGERFGRIRLCDSGQHWYASIGREGFGFVQCAPFNADDPISAVDGVIAYWQQHQAARR